MIIPLLHLPNLIGSINTGKMELNDL